MQQVDDPPYLSVGTEVSAKYKGAFCEAKVRKVVRNIKCKVAYKQGLGSGTVSDDLIKGDLRVGASVEVKHPEKRELVEATITKIQDCSQYTVVFDDGDITTLRRTALCLKSGRHFNESETLDQLPLTHPEHFGNPVIGGRRGRRSRHLHDDSSDADDDADSKEIVNEKEEHIGKVVCVEATETKKKDKEKWFPGLVVSPTAQVTVRIRVKDEYLVRSFKDGRYYTVPKKEAMEFTREMAAKQEGPAVQAALEYLDNDTLPPHWDRDALFGLANSSSEYEGEIDSDSSDGEPREEKDHFVAQLYKYMDDRGTPINKGPTITNRDVDLYRLFRAVQKLGGYNRVTGQNQWKSITLRLGFSPPTVSVTNLVKQAYKKFLQPFEEFDRKLGCSMSMTPRTNRSKGRSLVRANSVASPKPEIKEPKLISAAEESENTSESSSDVTKSKRKLSTGSGKVKAIIEKFEEKVKEECDSQPIKIAKSVIKEEPNPSPITPVPSLPSISNTKKEKYVKKKEQNSEERRGRKKKEGGTDSEKSGDKTLSEATSTIPEFPVDVGDKLKVYYHEKKVTYEAKVIEISMQQGTTLYLVHYTGWNTRYDEWVPRERIADNLTTSKTKRSKTGSSASRANQGNQPPNDGSKGGLFHNDKNNSNVSSTGPGPKGIVGAKRGRGRSDSHPSRSSTPSPMISNLGRTKSPATQTIQRRITRGQPNTPRRTSNNISDISMQTDSDTDSDEPVKKPTRSNSASTVAASSQSGSNSNANKNIKSTVTTGSSQNSQSETEEEDISGAPKGRDYDLNQIRSELKGFKEIKSPSPELESPQSKVTNQEKKLSNVFDFSTTEEMENKAIGSTIEKSSSPIADSKSSTDVSSETDSFADDDSQSSDKTTMLKNMTEKFQQKVEAEKLAQAKVLGSGKGDEKILPIKSSGIDEIIKNCLAEKMKETMKAKPFTTVDKIDSTTKSSIEKDDKSTTSSDFKSQIKHGQIERDIVQTVGISEKKIPTNTEVKTMFSSTEEKSILPKYVGADKLIKESILEKKQETFKQKASIIVEQISFNTLENEDIIKPKNQVKLLPIERKPLSSNPGSEKKVLPITDIRSTPVKGEKKVSPVSENKSTGRKVQVEIIPIDVIITGKTTTVSAEKPPKDNQKLIAQAKLIPSTSSDIYEFKEPEPFEFESRKGISTNVEADKRPKKATVKAEVVTDTKITNVSTQIATKKNKKSPTKETEIKGKLIKLEEKVQITEIFGSTRLSPGKSENTFDALRKSPNFNVSAGILAEGVNVPVEKILKTIPEKIQSPPKTPPPSTEPKILTSISPFVETGKNDGLNIFDLKADIENTQGDSDSEKISKNELETVKKILSDANFDLKPPQIEKTSIADKVLKALTQQKQDETKLIEDTPQQPIIETPQITYCISEPPKIQVPAVLKKDIDLLLNKPILSSPEHKLDILESIAPKNNDLSETIQKLESAIQKTTSNVDNYDVDSSDSTDSERRLVIEDDSQSSDNNQSENITDFSDISKNIENINEKTLGKTNTDIAKDESFIFGPSKFQQSIFGIQSTGYTDGSMLNDFGVEPIVDNLPSFKKEDTTDMKTESVIPQSMNASILHSNESIKDDNVIKQENSNLHSESINLLLCEETIPGSPTPSKEMPDIKLNIHPIESDIKPVPMDIECASPSSNVEPPTSQTMLKENLTPNSSPRDSLSHDESSEDIKKSHEQENDLSPKKKRRTRKHSEAECFTKRRRTTTSNSKKHNGTDSDDNSDHPSQRTSARHNRPHQYNFIVTLDPTMSPNQRIALLKKKIQELRKTYNMIKAELASIDRRRKKLRRRERERKNQQKMAL